MIPKKWLSKTPCILSVDKNQFEEAVSRAMVIAENNAATRNDKEIIEDTVCCGIQTVLGMFEYLESETT